MARAIRVEGRSRIRLRTRPRGKVRRPRAGDKAREGHRSTVVRLETELEGKEFEENGINLKALSALWGDDLSEGVVYHYDISGCRGSEISEVGILKAVSGGFSPDRCIIS